MIGQRVFGGYIVTGLLGEGGMGAVYVAENAALGKKLAVKLLLPQFSANQAITERFIAEARAASAINHPNIIDIVDASQLDDGRWYIAMEHLDGVSLEDFARTHGPLALDTTLEILVQACAGLEAAHERGIIHRDLKPANLFVTSRPGCARFVKVLDFGIAKLTDEVLAGGIKTASHVVMGTPSYMSHEQAKGSANVDARSDIYALGVIAYQLLTGRLPYAATSIGGLVAAQLTQAPPDLRTLRADVPPGWVAAISSALSCEPEGRPASMRDFAQQLIAATPNGQAIAHAVCPLFFQSVPESAVTMRNGVATAATPGAAIGSPPAMPSASTIALATPTTLGAATGQSTPGPAAVASESKTPLAFAILGLAAALGVGAWFATRSASGATSASETQAATATPTTEKPDTPAAEATVTLRVETTPRGATVKLEGKSYGPTPVDVPLPVGETAELSIALDGYMSARRRVEAHAGMPALDVALTAKNPANVQPPKEVVKVEPTPEAARPEAKKPKRRKKHSRRSRPKPKAEKPKPAAATPELKKKPRRRFNPDAPAGS